MGLEINAYQAAIRSMIGRANSDFDTEMLNTLTKLFDAADDIEIFATAAIEDGKSISEGEERKEMLRKLGEVLSCVSLAAWELGATLDKVAFMNLNSVRNDHV